MTYTRILSLVMFSLALLLLCCQGSGSPEAETGQAEMDEHSPEMMETSMEQMGEHEDHDPKYGGIFFMALDEKHHLEGTLTPEGLFRVYLFDEFTELLAPEKVGEAEGTIHWGEFPDPPGTPLGVGAAQGALEAVLDREVEFPVTLTLMLRLPETGSGDEPELFTFVFDEYSMPSSEGH